jgi:anti-sigma factor RsiW
MSDCSNVEIRELLPEYIGGTLSDARRSEVSAHLATCQECAEELELLKLVREAYAATTPAVNVDAIVSKLPRKPAAPSIRSVRSGAPVGRSWIRSQVFQIAAVVSFVAVGGISLAVARSFFDGNTSATNGDTTVAIAESPAISFAGGLSDLGDEDVEALLSALDNIEALPVVETADPPLSGTGRQGS